MCNTHCQSLIYFFPPVIRFIPTRLFQRFCAVLPTLWFNLFCLPYEFSSLAFPQTEQHTLFFLHQMKQNNNNLKKSIAQGRLLTACVSACQLLAGYYWLQSAESDEPESDGGSTARPVSTHEAIDWERWEEQTTHFFSQLHHSLILPRRLTRRKILSQHFLFISKPEEGKQLHWKDTPSPVWVCCWAGRPWLPGSSCPPALWAWTWWWDDPSSTFSHNLPLGKATERVSEMTHTDTSGEMTLDVVFVVF